MAPDPDASIFLIGFMATGKSTVGRVVARRLGWLLVDLDDAIARDAGRPVAQIFADEGEAGFRAREAAAVVAACAQRRTVVATGGGAACREDSLQAMLAAGRVVALQVTAEEAIRRAGAHSGRPMLDRAADPLAAATALLEARLPFYRRAHLQVETVGRTPEQVAGDILDSVTSGVLGAR